MEREKIIAEMAKDIHNAKKASDYHCYEDEYTDCKKCKFLKYAENKMCQDAYEACSLIEDGWCKIHEGAVVLTKEEYERLKKEELYAHGKYNLCHGDRGFAGIAETTEQTGQMLIDYDRRIRKAYDEIIPKLLEENKQARKETAREILSELKTIVKSECGTYNEKYSLDWNTGCDMGMGHLLWKIEEIVKEKYGVEVEG